MNEQARSAPDLAPSVVAEIKLVAQDKDEDVVRTALGLIDRDPEHRDIFFFDTQDLLLFDRDIVLRARLVQDGEDDSTVKLRPFPAGDEEHWKEVKGFEVELDVAKDEAVRSAKLSVGQRRGEITRVLNGERPIQKLFSEEQERLIRTYSREGIPWDGLWEDLRTFGPVKVHKWEVSAKGFPHEIVVEEWMLLPSARDIVELSIKVESAWPEASEEFRTFLGGRDIHFEADQQAKTRSVLEQYARSNASSG
jgi:hypothetical protein